MDVLFRGKLFSEAIRIGDQLLENAIEDEHGLHWDTLNMDTQMNLIRITTETLYQGSSGIVLFLLKLYTLSKDEKHLNGVLEGSQWLIWNDAQNPTDNYAFYTGRMSSVFTLIKVWEATGNQLYLEAAHKIAQNCEQFISRKNFSDDIMNGISGTLLVLLHLHQSDGKKWVLEKIMTFARLLISRMKIGMVGFYWDRAPHHIQGLSGFGHGTSGIAFALLETGYYLNNPVFYGIARHAFLYEDHFFDPEKQNWPDFRKGIFSATDLATHQQEYAAGNFDFFTMPKFMNAWCHGAAGIGLTRARAAYLWREEVSGLDVAIDKVLKTDAASENIHKTFALCHGGAGNAEVLLTDAKYILDIEKIAVKVLQQRENTGFYLSGYGKEEDQSLFLGNAGIGYFFLRILDAETAPSVLAPVLEHPDNHPKVDAKSISFFYVNEMTAHKLFGRTFGFLNKYGLDPWKKALSVHEKIFSKEELSNLIRDTCAQAPAFLAEATTEIFNLEMEKIQMDEQILSWSYLNIRAISEQQKAVAVLNENNLANIQLEPAPGAKFIETRWNWSDWQRVDPVTTEPSIFFIRPHTNGIIELKLLPILTAEKFTAISDKAIDIAGILQRAAPLSIEQAYAYLREWIRFGILTVK